MKYESDSKPDAPQELREHSSVEGLDFPVPTEPLVSWRGVVSADAALEFSTQQLERCWSDPEFVRRRQLRRVNVPFELK
jgi:hypothetical protein